MTSPPSFSSFPDFSSNDAGPSRLPTQVSKIEAAAPVFSSFPELNTGTTKRSRRSRSTSLEKGQDRMKSQDHRYDVERERNGGHARSHRAERDKDEYHRSEKRRRDENRTARDTRGHDSHSRQDDKKERIRMKDERHRRRSRSRSRSKDRQRDKDRHRHKDKHRDRSAERQYKEDRRRRERDAAQELIRGDVKASSAIDEVRRAKEERSEHTVKGSDDVGVPWYESSGKGHGRGEYEEPFDPTSSKAFFADTVGDRDIVKYGQTSSTSVPRYYRDGRNRILGLNEGLRIVYSRDRTQKGVEIAPLGKPYIPRYNSRATESTASRHLRRILLVPSETQPQFDQHSSFVAFETRPRRVQEDVLPAYRSISHVEEDEDDLNDIQAAIGLYSTLEDDVRKRTGEMERHLRSHPEDVDSWIEYSQLHLRLVPEAEHRRAGLVDPAKLATTRGNAEVTLSILSRALDADETNMTSPKLHLAYLAAAEQFWPVDKVTARWKNVLRELGETGGRQVEEGWMEVWLAYIGWREGQGFGKGDENGGGVDEVIDVYIECIERMRSGDDAGNDIHAREENLLYLFLRACLFLRQSGYTERALAAFQAQMEITFFKPGHLRQRPESYSLTSWFDKIQSEFEEFWDSEAPRIGEDGSLGWRDSMASSDPPSSRPSPSFHHISDDPFERWLEAESHAESSYALPGRATDLDPETEDDPYHVILFSDIQPFLFAVTTPEVRLQLIYAFLTFLGLPFSPPGVPSSSPANTDPHLRWSLANNASARQAFWPPKHSAKKILWQTVGGEPMEPERPRGMEHPFGSPIKSWVQDRGTMLGRQGSWFKDLDSTDLGAVDVELVRNVFSLLWALVPDPAFTLASFAFESTVSQKSAVKLAKSILSSDRNNLLLWDGYARIERQRGNVSAARTVYVTALQAAAATRSNEPKTEDEIDVWASWAEMEWESGEDNRCLEVLLMAAGIGEDRIADFTSPQRTFSAPTSVAMLKAKHFYTTLNCLAGPSQLLLGMLFAYLVDGVDSARSLVIETYSKQLPASAEAEESLQLLSKLLYLHASRHPSPPSLSRNTLELALRSFPNNTSFLSLYLHGELGSRVYGRVQRLIADLTSSSECGTVVHLWAVWAEAVSANRTFWDAGGGGAERVRLALDKGVNSTSGRYSAPLWMLYIEFETLMGRHQTAKSLCYRAVSTLGGCKQLYLLPFTPSLRPHFTPRELKDWAELMIERGLRLRVPFERFWTNDEPEEILTELPEDEEMDEDELGFLREREGLKPY
ncbi:hypothetical protein IAU59_004765 [Kwoniella sp. CBS 9459]